MDKITISDNELSYSNLIGMGSEGRVFKYDNQALKLFYQPTENKLNKLKFLSQLDIKDFVMPKKLVFDQYNNFSGFTMPLINLSSDKNLEVRIKNLNTLKEKIYYLKKQEELIKRAHENNLILIDLNPKNFIIDKNDNLIAIDTDNYIVNEYKNDIFPTYFYEYYTSKVSHNIDNNIDKLSYTLYLLYMLALERYNSSKLLYYNNDDYIEKYVESLDLTLNIKEKILINVSDSKDKVYLDDTIDELESESSFIKCK